MKKVLLILIAFVLFTFIALCGYLQTSHAEKFILSLVTKMIKDKTGHTVEVEALSFLLPFNWLAYNVKVKEQENTWLSIGRIEISIPFWDGSNKAFSLRNVSFVDVHVAHLPSPVLSTLNEVEENAPGQINLDGDISDNHLWDNFPYNIKISSIHVRNLSIEPSLLTHEFTRHLFPLDLDGSLNFNPSEHLVSVDLSAKQNSNSTLSHLHFVYEDSNRFRFNWLENKEGLISRVLNLSLPYETLISFKGSKKLDKTYEGNFNLKFFDGKEFQSPEQKILGDFFYLPNSQLNLSAMRGSIGPLNVQGEIFINMADFKIQKSSLFHLEIPDCSQLETAFSLPLKGSLNATAALSGTLSYPIVDLELRGNKLKIYDELADNLIAEASLVKLDSGLDGHAFYTFEHKQMRFKADHIFHCNENQISLTSIQAEYGSAQLKGTINYLPKTKIFEGELNVMTDDNTAFQNFFNRDMLSSGSLALKFYGVNALEDDRSTQNVDFSIHADEAHYDTFQVKSANLSGIISNLFKNPTADITLTAKQAFYNGWKINEFTADTVVDPSKNFWPFKISTDDALQNDLSAQANGHWHLSSNDVDIHLDLLHGQLKTHDFELLDPVTFYMQKDVFELSPLLLNIGKGTIYTTVDYKSDQAHTTTRVTHVPLEIFYPPKFIIPFTGTLSGEAYLYGTPGKLTGQIQAHLSQVKILEEAFQQTSLIEASVSGTIGETHISCASKIIGVTAKPIEITAELPITASLNPPSIHVNETAPLTARIKAEGDIAPLLQLLVIDTSSLSGKTSVILAVSGSFNDPHVSGDIAITNGTFESSNTGAVYHHLNAHLEAHDKILILKEFTALDLSDGKVQGNGVLELKKELDFPFTLNVQLSGIRLLNLDFVKAMASGEVVFTGNSRHGKIKGVLTTDSVQATIPDQIPALAHALDIQYINAPEGTNLHKFATSQPRWPLECDVQINVQKNATIKAKNLSSYWHGGVKVEGMAHAPQLFGDFKIVKGEYQFNGQTFDIKEGTISFAGEPEKKTTLYVIASKDLGKIVAEIILKGPVKNPLIAFRSNPPMSQREILSWILFGIGTTDITPFQGTELSQSISNLTKTNKSEPSVLSKIRDRIGIDRIDISKTEGKESNEVSLQVGKYISRGVLVKINKSITSEANQVGIEANILPNIKAEAQVGDDSSAQLQLKWKRDY